VSAIDAIGTSMLLNIEAMIMKKTDTTDKYSNKTVIDIDATDASHTGSITGENTTNVTPISKHPRHPSQQDRKLIEGVIRGDRESIARFVKRIEPYLEIYASDRLWADFDTGYRNGWSVVSANAFDILRRWDPEKSLLSQHIQSCLTNALTTLRIDRRKAAVADPLMAKAIVACRDDLTDTHFFLLTKLIIDGVKPKQLPKYFSECPELSFQSSNSIGTSFSRALKRLAKVCPEEYKEVVMEFFRTRKKSGRR
jgi:hypothetical protein